MAGIAGKRWRFATKAEMSRIKKIDRMTMSMQRQLKGVQKELRTLKTIIRRFR